jgi:hypothetical protein
MSTYDDAPLSDQHAVSAHLTTHHAHIGSIISNHPKPTARQPTTTTQRALVVTARQAHDKSAPEIRPPAKIIKPVGKDADAKADRFMPSINFSHACAFVMGHKSKCNSRVMMVVLSDA